MQALPDGKLDKHRVDESVAPSWAAAPGPGYGVYADLLVGVFVAGEFRVVRAVAVVLPQLPHLVHPSVPGAVT